jgi:Na+-transporting NADH:ubiquinone oxidoreductase subunit NqrC
MNATTLTLGLIVAITFICGVFYLVRGIKAVLTSQQEEQPLLWHQQPDLMAGLMMLFGAGILAIFPVAIAIWITSRNGALMILSGLLILAWLVRLGRSIILQQRQFRAK